MARTDMTAAVKERPILFSGPMVRAILDGRKTQTRRVVKPQPEIQDWQGIQRMHGRSPDGVAFGDWRQWRRVGEDYPDGKEDDIWSPYAAGDRLWVRETHSIQSVDGMTAWLTFKERMPAGKTLADTDAGLDEFSLTDEQATWAAAHCDNERWRPAIHMPRWASRITLEITEVRVQRLQEISDEDALAEGIERPVSDTWLSAPYLIRGSLSVDRYARLWDSINGKRPGCAWSDNPWVWCVSFRRIPNASQLGDV